MKGYLLSKDLMFTSQVHHAAGNAGIELTTIHQTSELDPEFEIAIVDLAFPGLDVSTAIADFKDAKIRVVAVGPHVQQERLAAAESAGAWQVLTKGQAHRDLADVLNRL